MGVDIADLMVRKEIATTDLAGKIVAVDAHLFLYQFLTTIRQRDGAPLQDSQGNVTSHLSGVFSRSAKLIQQGIRLAYVFDGEPPELKRREIEKRRMLKEQAAKEYEKAAAERNIDAMRKYASRTTRLTAEMIEEAKRLIHALGMPVVEAPSEGEAQAAMLVKQGKAFAVASQDADALLFGATRLVRNLSMAGRRKRGSKLAFDTIKPEMVVLADTLNKLGLDGDQLIALGMLIGTDFNDGGIKGVGPKKALVLLKEHKGDLDALFKDAGWDEHFSMPWSEVFYLIKRMPVDENVELEWRRPDERKVVGFLVEERGFSEQRVRDTLKRIAEPKQVQTGLGEFV